MNDSYPEYDMSKMKESELLLGMLGIIFSNHPLYRLENVEKHCTNTSMFSESTQFGHSIGRALDPGYHRARLHRRARRFRAHKRRPRFPRSHERQQQEETRADTASEPPKQLTRN